MAEAGPASGKTTLYRGWLEPGRHVWSPFVVKLEARLRLAGVRYATDAGSPRHAPRGKIPYVEHAGPRVPAGAEGGGTPTVTLADSALIIRTFVGWGLLPDLDAALSPAQRAQDLALRALLEDKLYFYHTWERWVLNYHAMRDHALWNVPWPARLLVGLLVHRAVVATLHGQGTTRHSADEIAGSRRNIWEAVNALLTASRTRRQETETETADDGPFWVLGGHGPSEADATLFGFVVSVLICDAGPDSRVLVKSFPVVVEYAERIHDQYFPDYAKW